MVSPDLILTAPDTAAIPTEPSALYAVVTAIAMRVAEGFDDALLPLSRDGFAERSAASSLPSA